MELDSENFDKIVENISAGFSPYFELVGYALKDGEVAGVLSTIHRLTITRRSRSSGTEEELSIILKVAPRDAERSELVKGMKVYENEIKMYTEVLPRMVEYQLECGIPEAEIYQPWPIFYGSLLTEELGYIAIQDLTSDGYYSVERGQEHSAGQVEEVVMNLAKFHALTYAMFGGEYKRILDEYPILAECTFASEEPLSESTDQWLKATIANISRRLEEQGHPKEAQEFKALYANYWADMFALAVSPASLSVITHGDCWMGNFFFHDAKPFRFIDFQLSAPAARGLELGYFMYTSIPEAMLNENEEELLRVYHDEFGKELRLLGVTTFEETFETFSSEYSKFRKYGMMKGILAAAYFPETDTGGPSCLLRKVLNLVQNHVPKLV